ncbi:hypothetical protein N0V90_013195 [Kalmusia sp. IMI 367209]|nr:hypothetical protein N0V90_013195 [Kalmusia sp. IMI 367209]
MACIRLWAHPLEYPPELCPYSSGPDLSKDLDKMIDYAVGLHIGRHDTVKAALNVAKSISQIGSFTNYYPMFFNVEVKRYHLNKDPAILLAARVAAQ